MRDGRPQRSSHYLDWITLYGPSKRQPWAGSDVSLMSETERHTATQGEQWDPQAAGT